MKRLDRIFVAKPLEPRKYPLPTIFYETPCFIANCSDG